MDAIATACRPGVGPGRREVVGFPGYLVGDDGTVWSRRDFQGGVDADEVRPLRPVTSNRWGHRHIKLRRDGRTYTRYVHRLVLEAFVGPCPPDHECRHLDGNPRNNRLDNLAWGTRQENQDDRVRHGTILTGERHPGRKLDERRVREIREMAAQGAVHQRIASGFGICQTQVSAIVRGEYWRATPCL